MSEIEDLLRYAMKLEDETSPTEIHKTYRNALYSLED